MDLEEAKGKKKNNTIYIILIVILAIIVGVIVLFINLFAEKSTYTSAGTETTSTESLYCTTKSINIDGAFFDLSEAAFGSQAIKIIFKDNKINDISYNATAEYDNADIAKTARATLSIKYDNYVQENNKKISVFSPNFSVNDSTVSITLTASIDNLTDDLSKIFLIDTSSSSIASYTPKVLSTLYKSKGFSCESKK